MASIHHTSAPNLGQENPPPGEAETIKRTLELFEKKQRETYPPASLARRGQHAKTTACVRAEFIVDPKLPPELRVGVFATPRSYPAWIRFSNGSEKVQPDTTPDVRAIAIKLLDVPGDKILDGEKDATTQDFILANAPALFAKDAAEICEFAQRASSGKMLGYFLGWNPFKWRLRGLANLLRSVLGRVDNPLAVQYWSQTPLAFGNRAVKYKVVPLSPKRDYATVPKGANYHRQAMAMHLRRQDAWFAFMVQLQLDPAKQPVEDAAKTWCEKEAPFVRVATIRIPAQRFDTPQRDAFAEALSYNPWHSLAEHRPLGGINRVRKAVYEAISRLRHEHNGSPRKEPTVDDNPDQPVK